MLYFSRRLFICLYIFVADRLEQETVRNKTWLWTSANLCEADRSLAVGRVGTHRWSTQTTRPIVHLNWNRSIHPCLMNWRDRHHCPDEPCIIEKIVLLWCGADMIWILMKPHILILYYTILYTSLGPQKTIFFFWSYGFDYFSWSLRRCILYRQMWPY